MAVYNAVRDEPSALAEIINGACGDSIGEGAAVRIKRE
jgi:hypothetical protein